MVLSLLVCCATVQSMDNSAQPASIFTQLCKNQLVRNAALGLGVAGLVYLGQRLFTSAPKISYCVYAGLAGLGSKCLLSVFQNDYCSTPYTSEQLLNLLINDPKKALDYSNKICKEFYEKIYKNSCTQEQRIKFYTKKCPFFLLGECTQNEDYYRCILSRSYNPLFRERFESNVVTATLEKLKTNTMVNYVSFGSGGMFQDLVIIAKVLAKEPTANININVIDTQYGDYVCMREYLKNGRQVSREFDDTPPEDYLNYLLELAKKESDFDGKADLLKLNHRNEVILLGKRYQQFILFLQEMFPKANLSLSVYASTDDYLKCITADEKLFPDLIVTADIDWDDLNCLANKSTLAYIKLCLISMQKKSTATNVWLSKGCKFKRPKIVTYSLKKIADATSVDDMLGKFEFDQTIGFVWTKKTKI